MLRTKKIRASLLLGLSTLTLASCSTTYIRYPLDYSEVLYGEVGGFADTKAIEIVENTKEQYYKTVLSTENLYSMVVSETLNAVSAKAHNYANSTNSGSNVNNIIYDADLTKSVADDYDSYTGTSASNNLSKRAQESILSTAKNGTYTTDNLYMESDFITALKRDFTLGDSDATAYHSDGVLITPFLTAEDVFGSDFSKYSYYFTNSLYEDFQHNYLTSEYIYNKNYSSIGNTNARKVQVIALTDRSDDGYKGSAKKLLDAYVRDYIKGTETNADGSRKYYDPDFSVLSRLWKGITDDVIASINPDDDAEAEAALLERYSVGSDNTDGNHSVVVTADEKQWLIDNGIIKDGDVASSNYTLAGKITKEHETVLDGLDDYYKLDSDLESTYTGSYTYDVSTGVRKQLDTIATTSLVTTGLYLKSDGISSLPEDVSDRLFDLDLTADKTTIETMKANPGDKSKGDSLSVYENDGFRYITTTGTLSSDNTSDDIVYYDASNGVYYITRVLDVVSTSSLSTTNTNSIYDTAAKKEQLARETAYVMSTTGSYKTNSDVYWLRRLNWTFYDEDFLDYMKSNYNDLFKITMATDGDDVIKLSAEDYTGYFD